MLKCFVKSNLAGKMMILVDSNVAGPGDSVTSFQGTTVKLEVVEDGNFQGFDIRSSAREPKETLRPLDGNNPHQRMLISKGDLILSSWRRKN